MTARTRYWLVKSEPRSYSWSDFVREGGTCWDGVRNHQARGHLAAMSTGDLVFFYHSVSEKAVVGIARVRREAYPDPTAENSRWLAVDLEPVQPIEPPVPLARIKQDPALAALPLVRQSRLSVMPLSRAEFQRIRRLARTP
ncbi:MAG: EVE domain-containing protein [Deltaproteobacteria bacterium]|nr:MAG: EVE domain-containing protein [Deltaproteobacteria bacterium]